ncbi:hypothetical protein ACH4XT_34450 [Streptomyces avidinii]|uniref:hypothetical protein n=1 Tax=Streptomyces avidinii TaxID=1895 RepID=UPI0037ABD6F3
MPFLLAEVFASNIGGTATLVGDPPNRRLAAQPGRSGLAETAVLVASRLLRRRRAQCQHGRHRQGVDGQHPYARADGARVITEVGTGRSGSAQRDCYPGAGPQDAGSTDGTHRLRVACSGTDQLPGRSGVFGTRGES